MPLTLCTGRDDESAPKTRDSTRRRCTASSKRHVDQRACTYLLTHFGNLSYVPLRPAFSSQALCWWVSGASAEAISGLAEAAVSMEQHPTHIAAIGILTQRPSGALERDMWAAYERHASRRVLLRHCVFEDETRERGPAIAALQRPSYAPWAQLQCVAKILQWLRHAVDERLGRFVGWLDSDTWMHPQRLAAHLSRVHQAVPRGADVWGGFWEHWERAAWDQPGPPKSLGGVGFSYSPLGLVTAHKESAPR